MTTEPPVGVGRKNLKVKSIGRKMHGETRGGRREPKQYGSRTDTKTHVEKSFPPPTPDSRGALYKYVPGLRVQFTCYLPCLQALSTQFDACRDTHLSP